MIHLPPIFASKALYQQNSVLELRGTAQKHVFAELRSAEGNVFSKADADIDSEGHFSMTIHTPSGSRAVYQMYLWEESAEADPVILEDLLFGELWLASGQSNMQLTNQAIEEYEGYLEKTKGLPLRIYCQNMLGNEPLEESQLSADMPIEPQDILTGTWENADHAEVTAETSAAATAFICRLYQLYKKEGCDIPVGFVNCNVGSTRIEGWLPLRDIEEDDKTAVGSVVRPDPKTWNSFGGENFLQSTAMYNLKVYSLRGLKFTGIIWYQGESNINREGCKQRYQRYLERYYRTYQEMFSAHENFHMIMAQLFPFSYGNSGECLMTCINQAIAETARDHHDRFTAVSDYDLPPVWGYQPFYHPIHPTNKYPLGERMAEAYVNKATAPTLRSVKKEGSRLLLTFDNSGGELRIKGARLYGLYIRGENTDYLEAEGVCIDQHTLAVWHPFIENPVHTAYQCASMACDGNLYGRYLPVSPFSTEDPWMLHIEGKPWLHTEKTAAWFCNCPLDTPPEGFFDYFMHPIWQPLGESEVCSDPVFFKNIASLRISGETNRFGVFTKRRRYNELDLQNYEALRFWLFNADAVSGEDGSVQAEILFSSEKEKAYVITRKAERISEGKRGWAEFRISFGELPGDVIERLTLTFDVGRCVYHFVNMDALVLEPGKPV